MSEPLTDDHRELLRCLSTQATMVLEDLHECVVLGQSPDATSETYIVLAALLERAGSDLTAIGTVMRSCCE